jgi:hypothetical protein
MRKITHAILTGAFALSLAATAFGGTTYVSTDKNVAPTQPPPLEPCAGPISYNNIELMYAYTEFDNDFGSDDSMHGAKLNIEFSPFKNFYLTAGGEWFSASDADLWTVNAGIGAYFPMTEHIHLAADGGILWTGIEFDDDVFLADDSEDDTGWYVRPHLRAKWGCFEAKAGALYRDMGDFNPDGEDGRWAGFAQLYYHITTSIDLTAGVVVDEDLTQVNGGIRWRF